MSDMVTWNKIRKVFRVKPTTKHREHIVDLGEWNYYYWTHCKSGDVLGHVLAPKGVEPDLEAVQSICKGNPDNLFRGWLDCHHWGTGNASYNESRRHLHNGVIRASSVDLRGRAYYEARGIEVWN